MKALKKGSITTVKDFGIFKKFENLFYGNGKKKKEMSPRFG
jgi:hypothetical protein